jgi:hypothetical protein
VDGLGVREHAVEVEKNGVVGQRICAG